MLECCELDIDLPIVNRQLDRLNDDVEEVAGNRVLCHEPLFGAGGVRRVEAGCDGQVEKGDGNMDVGAVVEVERAGEIVIRRHGGGY